jgi:hypothetical protein
MIKFHATVGRNSKIYFKSTNSFKVDFQNSFEIFFWETYVDQRKICSSNYQECEKNLSKIYCSLAALQLINYRPFTVKNACVHIARSVVNELWRSKFFCVLLIVRGTNFTPVDVRFPEKISNEF